MTISTRTRLFQASAAFAAASLATTLTSCGGDDDKESAGGDTTNSASNAGVESAAFRIHSNADGHATHRTAEYVGRIDGTEIYVAMALTTDTVTGEHQGAALYFCDGSKVSAWFPLASSSA